MTGMVWAVSFCGLRDSHGSGNTTTLVWLAGQDRRFALRYPEMSPSWSFSTWMFSASVMWRLARAGTLTTCSKRKNVYQFGTNWHGKLESARFSFSVAATPASPGMCIMT